METVQIGDDVFSREPIERWGGDVMLALAHKPWLCKWINSTVYHEAMSIQHKEQS